MGSDLLERSAECTTIETALTQLGRGRSSLLVFEGNTGVGKTSLVDVLRHRAEDRGIQVLHARGSEFETQFPFGVVRQLLEPWLLAAPAERRAMALSGAASLAASLFDYDGDGFAQSEGWSDHPTQRILHGLHWLCVNISEQAPLVIVVDDAQWSDRPSLHLLNYLTGRLDDGPILLAVVHRTDERGPGAELVRAVAASSQAHVIRPDQLSPQATSQLVGTLLDGSPSGRFTQACHETTAGNPLYLRELLAETTLRRIEPDDSQADSVRDIAPARVTHLVARRLRTLPAGATGLAGALAAIGVGEPAADLRYAARIAELDQVRAAELARNLVDVGILRPGPRLAFAQPILATAVRHDMPPSVRDRLHYRIARLTADAPFRAISAQLLRVQPSADPWVTRTLLAAGRAALADGDTAEAVDVLHRALAEPPPEDARAEILAELGRAQLHARMPEGITHLDEALRLSSDPAERVSVGINLARALLGAGRFTDAAALLTGLTAEVETNDSGLALRLRSELLSIDQLGDTEPRSGPLPTVGVRPPVPAPVDRRLRAQLAFEALTRGEPAGTVLTRLSAVLTDRLAPEEWDENGLESQVLAAWVLAVCDRLPEAEREIAVAERYAAEQRTTLGAENSTAVRALILHEAGRLPEAEATARLVLRAQRPQSLRGPGVALATAALIETLIDRDELDAAEQALRNFGLRDDGPTARLLIPVLRARGRLRIAQGEVEEGLLDLLECRGHETDGGVPPRTVSTLSTAALALARLGLQDEAATLAEEGVRLGLAFGAPRPTAVALRTAGLIAGGDPGLTMLEKAALLLEGSSAVLERARTLIHLGGALRRAQQRSAARRHLRAGVELAEQCGAVALCRLADTELTASGVRTRRGNSRAHSLTPREQHVAGLAADGMRNQEIAHSLFVTVKTVEWHLNQAYRKLGIGSRAELAHALTAAGGLDGR